ncbi:ABC transporter permease [Bacillus thuringiensis]|uniref:ABC transporter permease n=1 Tax=Bacillus thuringiensis TaxID=1428 RepID=UPI000BF8AA4A|nr:ABC transporter permease [Bacillus thuringiensis]PFJ51505.1 multidrug ABC transporter permease [Bacillus thuringiensis]PFR39091.1 multidrug ABC transporter permease [Bacillus thuringiensis]PGL28054.1 multidrug ABC transporter permease [Bacillus thuringiensis]
MVITLNNLKRIFKRKSNIIFMLVVPIVLTIALVTGSAKNSIYKVGIVDNDNTKFTEIFKQKLSEKCKIVEISKDEISDKIINNKVDYVAFIDKGFTQSMIEGKDETIKTYAIKETDITTPIKLYIKSFVSSAVNVGKASNGEEAKFYKGMDYYKDGNFKVKYLSLDSTAENSQRAEKSLGYLAMGILFLLTLAPTLILKDKETGVYERLLASPIKKKNYMFQNVLSFLLLSIIQIYIVLTILIKGLKIDYGPSFFNIFVICFFFSITAVSLGVAISNMAKNGKQANTIISLVNIPMLMLGGCFWPSDVMPDLLQKIGNLLPTTWLLKAGERVVNGNSLSSVTNELLYMLIFAVIFFLIASFKKIDLKSNISKNKVNKINKEM